MIVKNKFRFSTPGIALSIVAILLCAFFFFRGFPIQPVPAVVDSTQYVKIEKPIFKYGMQVNGLNVENGYIKRNQHFAELVNGTFIAPTLWQQLHLLPQKVFDFKRIAASKKYSLITKKDSLKTVVAVVYEPSPIEYVIFHLKDSLMVEVCRREISTQKKAVAGTINSSLSKAIESQRVSSELTDKLVDVCGGQIDFFHLHKGDRFKVIFEENLLEGKPFGVGEILGIYFQHLGREYYGIPFKQDGKINYYDVDGKGFRSAFLRYPIQFTQISSRYSLNRFHPVLNVIRPHLGTDFAAATGTPIRAAGDAVVVEAGYSVNNGNYVKLRHNGTYSTGYLHMSKIAHGIRSGVHVQQGQTIGYVGSTGLATGPHLCYRFWRNGVQVDALRVKLPTSKAIEKKDLPQFENVRKEVIAQLQQL